MKTKNKFIPALRFRWLTPLYDWLVRKTSKETLFKQKLVEQARLSGKEIILDVGCGTATLLTTLTRKYPGIKPHGIDRDPEILMLAKEKVKDIGIKVQLQQSSSTQLPFESDYFDKIFCSLMFHHLSDDDKTKTLGEIYRVLKPGGQLHFADWGKPSSIWIRWRFLVVQLLDGFVTTNACLSDYVLEKMQMSGFFVIQTGRVKTLVGEIMLLSVTKPS